MALRAATVHENSIFVLKTVIAVGSCFTPLFPFRQHHQEVLDIDRVLK